MAGAKQVISLLSGQVEGDAERVYTVALQIAASEARQGHTKTAEALRRLVDTARESGATTVPTTLPRIAVATPLVKPRGDLEGLVHVTHSETRLDDMTLTEAVRTRLLRLVVQQKQRGRLREYNQRPSSRLLLVGPPGSGKTLTASALAGELHLPLFTVRLDGVITRFLGESASKLRLVFDQIAQMRAVYLFDEFDAIGGKRGAALRFDLRRRNETQARFEARVNALAAVAAVADEEDDLLGDVADPGQLLGERSISAGSLHLDEWRCSAADLADRNGIAIFPVGGWWKSSRDRDRCWR